MVGEHDVREDFAIEQRDDLEENSVEESQAAQHDKRRKLDHVPMTFSHGWSEEEIQMYRSMEEEEMQPATPASAMTSTHITTTTTTTTSPIIPCLVPPMSSRRSGPDSGTASRHSLGRSTIPSMSQSPRSSTAHSPIASTSNSSVASTATPLLGHQHGHLVMRINAGASSAPIHRPTGTFVSHLKTKPSRSLDVNPTGQPIPLPSIQIHGEPQRHGNLLFEDMAKKSLHDLFTGVMRNKVCQICQNA